MEGILENHVGPSTKENNEVYSTSSGGKSIMNEPLSKSARAVLVTGASTGIGEACAMQLQKNGFQVFAGVRKTADAERIKHLKIAGLEPVLLDVTSQTSIDDCAKHIEAQVSGRGLFGLVNNAGIAVAGPLELLTSEHLREQFEVNVIGLAATTRATLPLLRLAKGRIVNMSSVSGKTTYPFLGAYCASKYAVEAISDALRLELNQFGIRVAVIEPGVIATPIWKRSEASTRQRIGVDPRLHTLYGSIQKGIEKALGDAKTKALAPSKVADAVVHALSSKRPKLRYLVGTDAKIGTLLSRWVPAPVLDKLILSQMR
jgi:NAD(P)-dependent dehydrogenase (short-subunit alcohol dehydrogenase family)